MANYSGYGIESMLKLCKKKGLTRYNSELHIINSKDLDSKWYITTK